MASNFLATSSPSGPGLPGWVGAAEGERGGGGGDMGGESAGVADGVLFSQASFVDVLSRMWLIRGKCSKSNRLLLVGAGEW